MAITTRRRIAALLVLLLLVLLVPATPASAQGWEWPTPPSAPPTPPSAPPLSSIPDVSGYYSFAVPQCSDCNGLASQLDAYNDVPFPQMSWDLRAVVGELFKWLMAGVENIFRWLLCQLLRLVQHVANMLANLVNAVVFIGNTIARLLIFAWLSLRSWFGQVWYLAEVVRGYWWQMLIVAQISWAWITLQVDALAAALVLLGRLLLVLLDVLWAVIQILAWLQGLSGGIIIGIITALAGTNIPTVLSSDTHPAYSLIRGALDALYDSQIAWLIYLYIAMAWLAFFTWLAKFWGKKEA